MTFLRQWMALGHINEAAYQKLSRFASLIAEWNPRVNLTGFRKLQEIEEILIGESLRAVPVLSLPGKSILDFGSGAGIPGIVWASSEPQATITSVEVRQKKVAFQKEVARELSLDIEVIGGLFPVGVAGRRFDLIVSRAIRFSPRLWDEAREMLNPGGRLVRFATSAAETEGWRSIRISPRSALLIRQP